MCFINSLKNLKLFCSHSLLRNGEQNKFTFLKAFFALSLYLENPHYININRIFKAQNENKTC